MIVPWLSTCVHYPLYFHFSTFYVDFHAFYTILVNIINNSNNGVGNVTFTLHFILCEEKETKVVVFYLLNLMGLLSDITTDGCCAIPSAGDNLTILWCLCMTGIHMSQLVFLVLSYVMSLWKDSNTAFSAIMHIYMYSTVKIFTNPTTGRRKGQNAAQTMMAKLQNVGVTDFFPWFLVRDWWKSTINNKKPLQNLVFEVSHFIPGVVNMGKHCGDSFSAVH